MLNSIFSILGAPNELNWPGFSKIGSKIRFESKEVDSETALLSMCKYFKDDPLAFDLFVNLVKLDPSKRLTPKEALSHPFFT